MATSNGFPNLSARLRLLAVCLFGLNVLTACTSLQPIAKIGLSAPFEGLYRRTGYSALDAMRTAVAETPRGSVDLLPLALDDSRDPARTAQKLLADEGVGVIVGPLSPAAAAAAAPALGAAAVPWIVPFAVDPQAGFADFGRDSAWADELVAAVAAAAHEEGQERLVLAGWTPGWPTHNDEEWSALAGLPMLLADAPQAVRRGDAVLWLGDAAAGADYLARLRRLQPQAPFWLGPQGDPVFAERAPTLTGVRWATWSDPGYNEWAKSSSSPSPSAYLVYRAARSGIERATGVPDSAFDWSIRFFTFDVDDGRVSIQME